METLKELKAIIADAPTDGLATNFYMLHPDEFDIKVYVNMNNNTWWSDSMDKWADWGGVSAKAMRSLSDIERIIELMENVEQLEDDMAVSCAFCGAPAE